MLVICKMTAGDRGWRKERYPLHADFCVEALEEALRRFGRPEIFNTGFQAQTLEIFEPIEFQVFS
jgi:hypothetical protein